MKPGNIIICRADELIEKVAELKPAAVLSIEHPDVKPGARGYAPRLSDTPQMILNFWDSEQAVTNGPDLQQIEQGIAFVMEHVTQGRDVIIHCHAGKSRSVAVALGVLSLLHPNKPEEFLIEKLLEIRPQAAPNILVVEMVDLLTGRDGRLLKAVNDNAIISQAREATNLGRLHWLEKNPETYKKIHPEKFSPPHF